MDNRSTIDNPQSHVEPVVFDMACPHVAGVKLHSVERPAAGCEDCLKMGGEWVHLRTCLTCGHVGCCDSSPNRHATSHFHTTGHPCVASAEPEETWSWCYIHERFVGR